MVSSATAVAAVTLTEDQQSKLLQHRIEARKRKRSDCFEHATNNEYFELDKIERSIFLNSNVEREALNRDSILQGVIDSVRAL
jgi:hypothetical protein